jgi:uncharacterized protein YpmB
MSILSNKQGTSREIIGMLMLFVLAIVVLIIMYLWLFGDYSLAAESAVDLIKGKLLGIAS